MTKEILTNLFEDFNTKSMLQVSKDYGISKTTVARWRLLGLDAVMDMKFKTCAMCSKEFYANKRNTTCSPECLKEQHNMHNIKSYHINKHKHYEVRAISRIKYKVMERMSKIDTEQVKLLKEMK